MIAVDEPVPNVRFRDVPIWLLPAEYGTAFCADKGMSRLVSLRMNTECSHETRRFTAAPPRVKREQVEQPAGDGLIDDPAPPTKKRARPSKKTAPAKKRNVASGKGKGDDGKVTLGEIEEMSEDEDEDDDEDGDEDGGSGREDTPDLYRNSALGM